MKTTGLINELISKGKFIKPKIRISALLVFMLLITQLAYSQFPCNDYKEPTIFCRDLHTSFMPGACMVEIWAKDLISKASDNKTAEEDLIIAFDPEGTKTSMIFMSEDGNQQNVVVYVIDECGNYALCIVTIFINDNEGNCPECPIDVSPWCGYAVITCSARVCDDVVAALIDTRQTSKAPLGDDWADPNTPGFDPVPFIKADAWTLGNLGMVYGIAVKPQTGDIFFAASDVYAFDFQQSITVGFPPPTCTGSGGSAGIYMSSFDDPENTSAIIFTSSSYIETEDAIGGNLIPNSGNIVGDPDQCSDQGQCEIPTLAQLLADTLIGNGIGNIAYDNTSNHLFASNLEDGKIYSISCQTNTITDIFDPFDDYDHAVNGNGLVDAANKVWAVQVNSCETVARLFFARETTNATPDQTDQEDKEIYSIQLSPSGTFIGSEKLEFVIERGDRVKITDIAFNSDCSKLLVAERGFTHSAEVYEYMKMDGDWVFNKQIFAGIYDPVGGNMPTGSSAAGGVSYGAKEIDGVQDAECDSLIWITTNCGHIPTDNRRCSIYGAEGVSATGNDSLTNQFTDIYIDFNAEFTGNPTNFKSNIGEIEIFSCCCPEEEGRNTIELATVAGKVTTSSAKYIKDVQVSLTSSNLVNTRMTNQSGNYAFQSADMYKDYMLIPQKDGNAMDGISTLDLLLIQNHLLGIRKLTSPYQVIAADINNSGSVSTKDILELRQLLLGMYVDFPSNNTWNFVAEDFAFADPGTPFPYNNYIAIEDLDKDHMTANFIAIKTGDVDGTFSESAINAETRELRSIPLNIEVVNSREGSKIHFKVQEGFKFRGFQMTLELDDERQLIGIHSGNTELTAQHLMRENNFINISWTTQQVRQANENDILFTLEFDNPIVEDIHFSSHRLNPEFYMEDYTVANIDARTIHSESRISGFRIAPNPFKNHSKLSFEIDSDQNVVLNLFSTDGRLLHSTERQMTKGANEILISRDDLQAKRNGVILVQLLTKSSVYNGKIIMVK